MTEMDYRFFIRSGWWGRVDPTAAIGGKFLKTLDALASIDPTFADWKISDVRNSSSLPLAAARPRIVSVIEDNVVRDDFDEPSPVYGYHAIARAGEFRDPRSVRLKVDAGSKYSGGTCLEFGEYDVAPDPAIVTYPMFKAALLAINAVWRPAWACAQCCRSGAIRVPIELGAAQGFMLKGAPQVPGDPTFPDSVFHIPWLAYFSAPLSAGLTVTPEILTERTSDGGLVMSASEDRLDPTNPEHVRRARILAETLIACTGYSSS